MSHAVEWRCGSCRAVLGYVRDGVLRPLVAGRVGGWSGCGSFAVLGLRAGQGVADRRNRAGWRPGMDPSAPRESRELAVDGM